MTCSRCGACTSEPGFESRLPNRPIWSQQLPVHDEANVTKNASHTNTRQTVTRCAELACFPTLSNKRRHNHYERSRHGPGRFCRDEEAGLPHDLAPKATQDVPTTNTKSNLVARTTQDQALSVLHVAICKWWWSIDSLRFCKLSQSQTTCCFSIGWCAESAGQLDHLYSIL
jgi:hypothetical protein